MFENEITLKEYEQKMLKSAKQTLEILKQEYTKEYEETIQDLKAFINDLDELEGYSRKEYSETEIITILDDTFVLDYLTDLIDEDIVTNYYVTDKIGTDRGVWEQVIESGYEIHI